MKSFFKNVINQKQGGPYALLGRLVQVGPYNLRVESHISDGGFAAIYKVRDSSSGKAYALKHMRLMGDSDAIADCMTEINALKALRQVPSVVSLRAAAFTGSKGQEQEAYLVLDLCTINLAEYINSQEKAMSTANIIEIFSCVCQAVSAMHQQTPPLSHRDLKPENVLQHAEGGWVLCDFGSVTDKPSLYDSSDQMMMGEEVMRKYTTPAYRAPEMWDLYSRERIDTKADIWALGCLLYFLMYGKLAFQAEAKLQILNGDVIIPPSRPPPLVELLRELLVVSPQRRPDILHVLRKLQEVAEKLNIDPALLIPSTPVPTKTGSFKQNSQAGLPLSSNQPTFSQDRRPSLNQASVGSLGSINSESSSQKIPPSASSIPSNTKSTPKNPSWGSPPFNNPNVSRSGSETKAQEGFADFEQAFANSDQPQSSIESQNRVETKPPISQNPIKASLPPQTQHTTQKASPPISHSPSVSPPHTRGQSPNLPKSQEPVKPSSNLGQQILALQRQLADSNSQNKSLKITLQSQQALIEKLKAENKDYITQLQNLGLDPTPAPIPEVSAPTNNSGWASFENSFESNSFLPSKSSNTVQHTTETFEPEFSTSFPSNRRSLDSPTKAAQSSVSQPQYLEKKSSLVDGYQHKNQQDLATDFARQFLGDRQDNFSQNAHRPQQMSQTLPNLRTHHQKGTASPQGRLSLHSSPVKRFQEAQMSQTTPANAFGGQVQGTTPHSSQANSPKTDSFSLGSPSETMSRKSALSAFEESLKQPALTSNDSNVASPLSESIPQESRTKSMPKFSKRTHRRSTSEPVAIENWNLIKDQSA